MHEQLSIPTAELPVPGSSRFWTGALTGSVGSSRWMTQRFGRLSENEGVAAESAEEMEDVSSAEIGSCVQMMDFKIKRGECEIEIIQQE